MKTPPDIYAENPVVDLDYKIAVMQAAREGKPVQNRDTDFPHAFKWAAAIDQTWNWYKFEYRIDPACKPQPPKVKVPLTINDFSWPVIWVRLPQASSEQSLIVRVTPGGVQFANFLQSNVFRTYEELMDMQYSTDRVNWKPCYKEVEQ